MLREDRLCTESRPQPATTLLPLLLMQLAAAAAAAAAAAVSATLVISRDVGADAAQRPIGALLPAPPSRYSLPLAALPARVGRSARHCVWPESRYITCFWLSNLRTNTHKHNCIHTSSDASLRPYNQDCIGVCTYVCVCVCLCVSLLTFCVSARAAP